VSSLLDVGVIKEKPFCPRAVHTEQAEEKPDNGVQNYLAAERVAMTWGSLKEFQGDIIFLPFYMFCTYCDFYVHCDAFL
jgi:hypothetical protein